MSTPVTISKSVLGELRRTGVEIDGSSRRRVEYSTDASLHRIRPLAVAFPRHVDEVAALVSTAGELGVSIVPRGAGTSIAGNAIGEGLVIDVSRHLSRITAFDPDAGLAEVEPGVVLADLQRRAAPHGLRFGPDPSTHDRATLGGMIGNNACGARALYYGRTSDNVEGLTVVLGDGSVVEVGSLADRDDALGATLTDFRDRNAATIAAEMGRFSRQVSGYGLEHLLTDTPGNLARSLVGSEGSCGFVVGARLRLAPTPAALGMVVVGFADIASAADGVLPLLAHRPVAVEALDARIVDAIRQIPGRVVPELPAGQAWLFVEVGGETPEEVAATAAAMVDDVDCIEGWPIVDPDLMRRLWGIREAMAGLSGRAPSGLPAHSGWEDSAVPVAKLGGYLRDLEALIVSHGLSCYPYGHFGDGCVHMRLDFDLASRHGIRRMRDFMLDAADLVLRHGGSMSGEHGDGRIRGELLERQYTPAMRGVFAEFKSVFDPDGIFNPGVIVDPPRLDETIAPTPPPGGKQTLGFLYPGDAGDFGVAVSRCVGVGKCRAAFAPDSVMCPSFRATGDERDSTRGRARVLQEMMSGGLTKGWRSPEVVDALDLCISCKACSSECPAGVDMATYKSEVLYQRYKGRLRPRSHLSLGRLPSVAAVASKAPRMINAMLANRTFGRFAKWAGGIDPERALPRFAPSTFRSRVTAGEGAADGEPIVLWVDTFTDHFTPSVGEAAMRVLERGGYRPIVVATRQCCGLTHVSTGQLDTARRIMRRAVDILTPHVEAGRRVVVLEPSCAALLSHDLPRMLGPETDQVAGAVTLFAELVAAEPTRFPLPDLTGVQVVAQPHCHQRATGRWPVERELLERSGADLVDVGGCCGLAGNFGAERGHFATSEKIAELELLPALRDRPDAVVLADGYSCRTQIDQLADRSSEHLAELLDRLG